MTTPTIRLTIKPAPIIRGTVRGIGLPGPPGASDWDSIANKPATFTPSAHTHSLSDLTGLGTGVAAALAIAISGSGGLVGATSPTLTTPTITGATSTGITFANNAPTITGPSGSSVTVGCPSGNVYLGNTTAFGSTMVVGSPGGVNAARLRSDAIFGWSADTTSYGAFDSTISRMTGGGGIQVGTTAANADGTILCGYLRSGNIQVPSPGFVQVLSGSSGTVYMQGGDFQYTNHSLNQRKMMLGNNAAGLLLDSSTMSIRWSANTDVYTSPRTGISESGAGVVSIDTTARNNALGTIKASLIQATSQAEVGQLVGTANSGFNITTNQGAVVVSGSHFGIAPGTNPSIYPDVRLIRNATGPAWKALANGGLQVRNITDNGDADISGLNVLSSGYISAATQIICNNNAGARINASGLKMGTYLTFTALIGWTGGDSNLPLRTALVESSSGVVEINNGTAGTYRDLTLRYLNVAGGGAIALSSGTNIQANGDGGLVIQNSSNTPRITVSSVGNVTILGTLGFSQSRLQQSAAQTLQTQCFDTSLAAWQETMRQQASPVGAKWSVFGATPIVQQTLPAAATDAATTQTLCNAIRSLLVNFGFSN